MTAEELEAQILAAHAAGDHSVLVGLYAQAADLAESANETGFFLTQAYIFALETAHPDRPALHGRLKEMGRER